MTRNYKIKFLLFFLIFLAAFFLLRTEGNTLYQAAQRDLGGIGWLFSTTGLIFSILSGFLIQHLWDKWERIQRVVLEEVHALEHLIMFANTKNNLRQHTCDLIRTYLKHVIAHEWTSKTKLLSSNEAVQALRTFSAEFVASDASTQEKGAHTKIMNTLLLARERRILLTNRRMPSVIKKAFLLSTVLVIGLSLFVAIESVTLDLIFTLAIGSLVFAIYLIVDDMDNVLTPGAWHVSSTLYKDFLLKIE